MQMVKIKDGELATVLFEPETQIADAVLVHGFTGSKEDFTDIGVLLAQKGFRVLTFDNRGHQHSQPSENPSDYEMKSIGQDVLDLAKDFNFAKPHLLGHSLGGLISQQAFMLEPSYWRSLTLMCSGPGGRSEFDMSPLDILTEDNKVQLWEAGLDEKDRQHRLYDFKRARAGNSSADAIKHFGKHLNTFSTLIPEIAKTGVPAHIFYGEYDEAWPLTEQNQMAQELNAKLDILPNCGHCPNEDDPELTAKVIADFWNQH
jgi:pimeloyl-ACP methyl ester carboxylesterase